MQTLQVLGIQNPNLASSVIFDPECLSWAKFVHLRNINLEITSRISSLPKSRPSVHSLWFLIWILYTLQQVWCVSHWEAWPLRSLSRVRRSRCVVGAATGTGPCDHSQPVAHMSSLSFSPQIKSALFILQNQRLNAGSSHGIVGLQKLGRRRSQNQVCCVAPTSLHPGLQPATIYDCRAGKLVRFFFQSRELWKGAQIYLTALWGPNEQKKKASEKKPSAPRQPAFLPWHLSPHCSPLPAALSQFHSQFVSAGLTSASHR